MAKSWWSGWWGVLLAALALAALWYHLTRPVRKPAPPEGARVPIGVEQAAIVTYAGPPMAVAPYRWGVAVNVRIASIKERAGVRVYDVRYLVNRGGTYDLKDYLVAENGEPLEGLPSFTFIGDPQLSKDLETRIRETEEVRVRIPAHYYAVLAGLALLWIVWLLLLIFCRRERPVALEQAPAPAPSLAELLRRALEELRSGPLDAATRARLEMTALRRWREALGLAADTSMHAALERIGRDERMGAALRRLQLWLHHRAPAVTGEEVAAALAPFAKTADEQNASGAP